MSSTRETRTELEIVELSNGEVVLRSTEEEGQPLVTISFSSEIRNFLGQSLGEIGKAMIGAGVEMVGEIKNHNFVPEEDLDSERILH